MKEPITALLFGAGLRGAGAYGPYALAHPDQLRFVAVAEPDPARRAHFSTAHGIPPERQFATWQEAMGRLPAGRAKLAKVVFICSPDREHEASGVAALRAGYDMLLEKPMANDLAGTVRLVQVAEETGRLLQVCHVLRYTPFFSTLHDIVASGRLGEVVAVTHRENVAYWHMAHSFVRGNWRNEGLSSPMILSKCCHDLDILYWNLGRPVRHLQSFGSLRHFRAVNAPPGAPLRCTDGCPVAEQCSFDARRVYLNMGIEGWPVTALGTDLSRAGRLAALETGPYGRCVYHCDNDVVDRQTVNLEFAGGTTAVLIMHGHSHQEGRTMRYDGTRATLRATFFYEQYQIEIHDHVTGRREEVPVPAAASGHGGGDWGVVRGFLQAIRGEELPLTNARASLESHLMAFAAERSRLAGEVVDMDEFRLLLQ